MYCKLETNFGLILHSRKYLHMYVLHLHLGVLFTLYGNKELCLRTSFYDLLVTLDFLYSNKLEWIGSLGMENFEYPCLLVNSTLQEHKLCLVQIMNMLLLKFLTKNPKTDFIVDYKNVFATSIRFYSVHTNAVMYMEPKKKFESIKPLIPLPSQQYMHTDCY